MFGFFQKLGYFVTHPTSSRTIGILAILIVAAAVPLTVFVSQKQQELRQRAAGNENCITDHYTNANCSGMPESSASSSGPAADCQAIGSPPYYESQQTRCYPSAPTPFPNYYVPDYDPNYTDYVPTPSPYQPNSAPEPWEFEPTPTSLPSSPPPPPPCSSPFNLFCTGTGSKLDISWSSVNGANSYRVEWTPSDTLFDSNNPTSNGRGYTTNNKLSVGAMGVEPQTTYLVRAKVEKYDEEICSAQSGWTTIACYSADSAPTNVPLPTATPIPTNTPIPTSTPIPTPTSAPAAQPPPAATSLAADVNQDGCISLADFNEWLYAYRTSGTPRKDNYKPNIDGQGSVDLLDYNAWYRAMKSGKNLCGQ